MADRVVMVTGAGGNVGSAVARRFAADGAKLVLVGRKADELQALVDELGGMPGIADVTDPASVDALVRQVEASYGRIDVLAHTVGGFAAGQTVHESGIDVFDKMMTLNAKSVYVTCGRVAQHMVEKHIAGSIVMILAKNAYKAGAKNAAYSASKAAAQRIMESMAAELGSLGIGVNGIVPSTIDTPQNRSAMPNADTSKWIQPEEIANLIAFLASDAGKSINGASIDIFGRV
ncbi:MAG: SDR family oxidoreductase [Anaerolineae bacterium]|nr:SDR family oxidoreductase [Anaerolineae bacterium]